jgi:hypothetical protein
MKNIRVEIKITAIVWAGEDVIAESGAPIRDPDAVETVSLATVRGLPSLPFVTAPHDAAGNLLAAMFANTAPVIGSRLNHELRKKGL